MRIAMIGTGYVGLVSGACFSDFGHDVVCVDKDARKIELLHQNVMPIYEPGLAELVASNVKAGRLSFTTDLAEGVKGADAVFIAVGTPSRRGDGHADLSYVFAAAEEIVAAVDGPAVIVTKSTVPVGTGDEVEHIVARLAPDKGIKVVSNPEFLREGAAIEDFKRPDRVVVGSEDERASQVMRDIYRPLSLNQSAPLLFTAFGNQFWNGDLLKPMASVPVTIFQFAMSPFESWQALAWAGALLLTLLVLLLSLLSRFVFSRRKGA